MVIIFLIQIIIPHYEKRNSYICLFNYRWKSFCITPRTVAIRLAGAATTIITIIITVSIVVLLLLLLLLLSLLLLTAQEMKFTIKDFFSKCDQIRRFLQFWSHLLKKSLMENFIFFIVTILVFVKIILK